jgi:hypothetical protein
MVENVREVVNRPNRASSPTHVVVTHPRRPPRKSVRFFKSLIAGVAARLGYEIKRIPPNRKTRQLFALYEYLNEDGSFDYSAYRRVQEEGNRQKLQTVWVLEENIAFIAAYIKNVIGLPSFGICHGTRRGKEQEWFSKYLGCEVIGTEISDTAAQFPQTIQWDFHETKPEWLDAADFIYSNSFDHSYDPEKCLDAWMNCVRTGGLCILEHSDQDGPLGARELDPFGADIAMMPYLITAWGKGKYCVRELLEAPKSAHSLERLYLIVIQKL